MKKQYLFVLGCLLLCAASCRYVVETGCAETVATGKGWALCSDNVLTITTVGKMPDYTVTPREFLAPWFELRDDINSVIIGNKVTYIGSYSFFRCENMTGVTIGDSVTAIGYKAFCDTGLTSVTVPTSVTTINDGAFASCINMTSITIPNSVTEMGNGTFYDCVGLISVVIPNSMTAIGHEAFYACSGLISVTIPSSVNVIDYFAFHGCSSLAEIINYSSVPQNIENNVFIGVDKDNCILYVPAEHVETYGKANVWKEFANIRAISDPS